MPKNNHLKDNKTDVVAMAKKKRHIHLLEKLQQNKSISKSEIKELAEYEEGSKSPAVVNSQDQVAKAFKVSARTVPRWIKDGMPVRPDGYYNIIEIQSWRTAREAENRYKRTRKAKKEQRDTASGKNKKAARKDASESFEYDANTDWISEKDKWDAILKRQKAEEAAGLLIKKEDAVAALKLAVVNVKRQFLAMPKQVAPQIMNMTSAAEVEHILDIRIREIIEGFARGKF